jgi:hypothetical protein
MKGRILFVFILIFLTSCEKGETDDTILKFFSKAYKDSGNSIAIGNDQDGNDLYYICGQFTDELTNNPNKRAGILKAGLDGNVIGSATVLGDTEGSAAKIIVLDDGDIVCTGYVLDSVSFEKDLFVCRLDPDLTTVKMQIYESPGNQYGVDILQTSEGFLVLATTDSKREPSGEVTGNPSGKKDILLMRIGSDLKPLSEIPAQGFNGNDEGIAVKKDRSGGFIIVGTTDRSDRPLSEQSGTNIIILRLNADGSTTQPRIVGKIGNETASDFEVLSDGYLITGTKTNTSNILQGYIWKIPVDIYSDPDFENYIELASQGASSIPYSIKTMCRYRSSFFILAGQYGTGLSARLLVFAVDAYGTPVPGYEKITGGTGTQIANDVVSDESDYIITVGSNSYENNSMICFLKFRF